MVSIEQTDDYLTLEEAAIILDVGSDLLEQFVRSNQHGWKIRHIVFGGERRFHLGDLCEARESDPTFGYVNYLSKQLALSSAIAKLRAVNRRFILKAAAYVAGGAMTFGASYEATILGVEHERSVDKDAELSRDKQFSLDIFRELFGHFDANWSYHLGKLYSHGGYHRDHQAACESILQGQPLFCEAEKVLSIQTLAATAVSGDMVVIGGPMSTPIVADAWQYHSLGDSGFTRAEKPLLRLPYSFLVDGTDDRMKTMKKVGWVMADGTLGKSLNRPLIDLNDRHSLHIPGYDKETIVVDGERVHVPSDNDLVITRLPNFLSKEYSIDRGRNPTTWGNLIVIQATNGLGTRAAGLLLTHVGKEALIKAKRDIPNDSHAFQVHFKVRDPFKIESGVHCFGKIDYVRSAVLTLKELPLSHYDKLRKIVIGKRHLAG